jgi:hypothetical protein
MVIRTYVNLECSNEENKEKALKSLGRMALDIEQVCVMDKVIAETLPTLWDQDRLMDYFFTFDQLPQESEGAYRERCTNILSKEPDELLEADFFYEWQQKPNKEQIEELKKNIEKKLTDSNCKFSTETKES